MKTCIRCQELKELSKFENHPTSKDGKRNQCSACRYKIRLARDPDYRAKQKDWNLGRYGITTLEYDSMSASQSHKCKICEKETKLVVDHDHKTGIVRGLLCHHCNTMLGLAKDSLQTLQGAIRYLESMP
jgi:hypothetical protein